MYLCKTYIDVRILKLFTTISYIVYKYSRGRSNFNNLKFSNFFFLISKCWCGITLNKGFIR